MPATTAWTTCRPSCSRRSLRLQHAHHGQRVAIAIDARSATSLPHLPPRTVGTIATLRGRGRATAHAVSGCQHATLVRRFSETRRRHPLAPADWPDGGALAQVIEHERELLSSLRECAHVIDTSNIRGPQLQNYVKAFIEAPANQLTLIFQSLRLQIRPAPGCRLRV